MQNEQTIETLNRMKLYGMAQSLTGRLADARQAELTHAEFVGLLAADEQAHRDCKRLRRLLRRAHMKQDACLENIDYRRPRGLNKQTVLELGNIAWLDGNRNVIITGPSGVGKSYIACALGNFAARCGRPVTYVRATRLFETLSMARADGSHLRMIQNLARARLLIVDDFLIAPLTDSARMDFLEVIEERCGTGAMVITSQCPSSDWHRNIGDDTIADAICDRLLHQAYKLELDCDSIRRYPLEKVEGKEPENLKNGRQN